MAIKDNTKIHMAVPAYGVDQIFGSFSNTVFLPAPTSSQIVLNTTIDLPTTISEPCFFEGIFSVDNGVTWNPFGSMKPDTSGPFPVFQTVGATAVGLDNSIQITTENWWDFVNSRSFSYTMQYRVVAFASNTNTILPRSFTKQKQRYNSAFNYQRIALKGQAPFTPVGGIVNTLAIYHGLGYVPMIRCFYRPNDPSYKDGYYTPIKVGMRAAVDENYLYWIDDESGSGGTPVWPKGTLEYRIYLDA